MMFFFGIDNDKDTYTLFNSLLNSKHHFTPFFLQPNWES